MAVKITRNDTAYGPQASIVHERKAHPASHFQPTEITVRRLDDGSFHIKKHHALKPKFENHEGYSGGYREPEEASTADHEEMLDHVRSHFGKKTKASEEDGEPEGMHDEEDEEY